MGAGDIKQFLLIQDVAHGTVDVTEFGTDEQVAYKAYCAAEAQHRGDASFDVLLAGSDSIDTIRVTHASYFGGATERLLDLVDRLITNRTAA